MWRSCSETKCVEMSDALLGRISPRLRAEQREESVDVGLHGCSPGYVELGRYGTERLLPEVLQHPRDGGEQRGPAEVHRAGGEHLRARGRLVVRHLGGERRDRRARGSRRARSPPAGSRASSRRSRFRSRRAPGRTSRRRRGRCPRRARAQRRLHARRTAAGSVRRRCRGTARRSAPTRVARCRATSRVRVSVPPRALHLPEEVVRGEEHQIAAEVAVALDAR